MRARKQGRALFFAHFQKALWNKGKHGQKNFKLRGLMGRNLICAMLKLY
jgi:hypothetical protein